MKNITLMMLCAVFMLSGSSLAAPLNHMHIPAEAKWLIHADFEAFKNQEKIDAITYIFGSDPTKDIYGITLYGENSEEENAVVMIYGRFDKEKLLGLLAQNEAYVESEYNGRKLYHWFDDDDNKMKVGMFAADDLIVTSQSQHAVQAAADMLAGKTDSLAGSEDAQLAILLEVSEDDAFVVMVGIEELPTNDFLEDPEVEILENSGMFTVSARENNGDIYLDIGLTTETVLQLKHSQETEFMSLLQAVAFQRNEKKLFLNFKYPSAKLVEIMDSLDEDENDSPSEQGE
ncbi:MAG: hypothetical protein ACYSYW_09100 [Planctomycetota bacterium]|jgi:hypothetical protein